MSFQVDIFSPTSKDYLGHFQLDGANLQTHFVPKIMDQKLSYFYGSCVTAKLGFIVLVLELAMLCAYLRSDRFVKLNSRI